ncbi:MAG: hypothetical protein DBX40_08470 [Clostridiales bacterium]|nr:MAG: hypothetical protein DBX40_08470 [Clostridiales bacterium]
MNDIAILPNEKKPKAYEAAGAACDFLRSLGMRVLADTADRGRLDADEYLDIDDLYNKCDAAVIFGGDGTMLRHAVGLARASVPMIGVNSGTLGYLTELETNEIRLLSALKDGGCRTEERMLLEAEVFSGTVRTAQAYALNEALISRGAVVKMLDFNLECDGTAVASYRSDGLIVSTPTGSTAYSMSAGGPIVDPRLDSFVVSPVCPHAFAAARALVFSPDSVLSAAVTSADDGDILFTCDGRQCATLESGDVVTVRRSELRAKLIRIKHDAFYQTLYGKFYAGRRI